MSKWTRAERARTALLVEVDTCTTPTDSSQLRSAAAAANLTGATALLAVKPNCSFGSFDAFQAHVRSLLSWAQAQGAAGALVLLAQPGQPADLLPGGVVLPACILPAAQASAYKQAIGSARTVQVGLEGVGVQQAVPYYATAQGGLNLTAIQLNGSALLGSAMPAWPALYNSPDAKPVLGSPVAPATVAAECLLGETATAFTACGACWARASPFANVAALAGAVALLDVPPAQTCLGLPEHWTAAAQRASATAILFAAESATRLPAPAGPLLVAANTSIATFSILKSAAAALATTPRNSSLRLTLPAQDPATGAGYPPYFAASAAPLPPTQLTFVVTGLPGAASGQRAEVACAAGQALFNPAQAQALAGVRVVFARPAGNCTLESSAGCQLPSGAAAAAKDAVVAVFRQDWQFFYSWEQHVALAAAAGARGLLVVGDHDDIRTLHDKASFVGAIPTFLLPASCGRRMLQASLQNTAGVGATEPSIAVSLPELFNGRAASNTSTVEPLDSLVDPAQRRSLPRATLVVASGTPLSAEQPRFNALAVPAVSAPLVLVRPAEACSATRTLGGTSCGECTQLEAARQLSSSGLSGSIAVVEEASALCLLPHASMVAKLQAQGAAGVLFVFDGAAGSVPLASAEEGGRTSIPAFGVSATAAAALLADLQAGRAVRAQLPALVSGLAAAPATPAPAPASVAPVSPAGSAGVSITSSGSAGVSSSSTSASVLAGQEPAGASSGGGGTNVVAIVVPAVIGGVVLLAAVAGGVWLYRRPGGIFGRKFEKYVDEVPA